MKTINVPSREQVSPESQEIFDEITKKMGKVPNLYATIGFSHNALKAMLDFERAFNNGVFNAKEREAIYLAVSQVNHCDYCLAAHSILAGMRGYNVEEILNLRRGIAEDSKLLAVVQLAKAIAESKGNVNHFVKNSFFDAGYDEAALIELTALVTLRTFTNYVYALTDIPLDFPKVSEI